MLLIDFTFSRCTGMVGRSQKSRRLVVHDRRTCDQRRKNRSHMIGYTRGSHNHDCEKDDLQKGRASSEPRHLHLLSSAKDRVADKCEGGSTLVAINVVVNST